MNERKSSRIELNHLFTTDSIDCGFVSIMRASAGEALVIDMNLQYMLRSPKEVAKCLCLKMFSFLIWNFFPYEPLC